MNLRTTLRGLSAVVVATALLAGPALVASPAEASAAVPDSVSECAPGQGTAPRFRRGADTSQVSATVKAKVAAELRETRAAARTTSGTQTSTAGPFVAARTAALPVLRIPVTIHVIHGKHRRDRWVTKPQARRLFRTLHDGFLGRQNPAAGSAGIVFELNKITVTRNDRWYHAAPMSAADKQMRRSLRRGKARMLNVYVNQPTFQGQPLLGYARFPWLVRRAPKLDGVTVSVISMAGGRATGYNLGDTIVHETGHWLGLLHTFEGGCDAPGDYVKDTAPEAEPSYRCDVKRDTCPTPIPAEGCPTPTPTPTTSPTADPSGTPTPTPTPTPTATPCPIPVPDPVRNFMDYSLDSCMNHFTQGQRERMVNAYLRYRAGR